MNVPYRDFLGHIEDHYMCSGCTGRWREAAASHTRKSIKLCGNVINDRTLSKRTSIRARWQASQAWIRMCPPCACIISGVQVGCHAVPAIWYTKCGSSLRKSGGARNSKRWRFTSCCWIFRGHDQYAGRPATPVLYSYYGHRISPYPKNRCIFHWNMSKRALKSEMEGNTRGRQSCSICSFNHRFPLWLQLCRKEVIKIQIHIVQLNSTLLPSVSTELVGGPALSQHTTRVLNGRRPWEGLQRVITCHLLDTILSWIQVALYRLFSFCFLRAVPE